MLKSLEELVNIIRERKNSSPDKSYTNKLLNNREMCVEKVNEEINELLSAIKENSNQVKAYLAGKEKLFGFFVGQVMKLTQGKANPKTVNSILKEKLKK